VKKKADNQKFFRFIRFSTKGPPTRSASAGTDSSELKKPSLSESFPDSLVHQYTGGPKIEPFSGRFE
jgi:hypothetical protein